MGFFFPYIFAIESAPVLLYLLMNHSVLGCHVNQCLAVWKYSLASFGDVVLMRLPGYCWLLNGSPQAKLTAPGGSALPTAILLTSCHSL